MISTRAMPSYLRFFHNLSSLKRDHCEELINFLIGQHQVLGILLGGSVSYRPNTDKSDVDLFCLLDGIKGFETELIKLVEKLTNFDVIVHQGSFPWTGNLYTLYYKDDLDFSIDLCLIEYDLAQNFFWEPNGHILYDKNGDLLNLRHLLKNKMSRHPFLKENPFSMSTVTLKKIDKNLSRKHYWNALEQLNILRRYLMQIVRISVINDQEFLGRVDRDIEDVLPSEINQKFINSISVYNEGKIAEKSLLLAEWLISLLDYMPEVEGCEKREWIIKQLKHEKHKLKKYTLNA